MILVTGANGLVGAAIARALLQDGQSVRALKRPESDLNWARRYFEFHNDLPLWEKLEWEEGDVLDVPSLQNAVSGCQKVVHTAALVSFHSKDSEAMLEVNATGTANVVNVCLAEGVEYLMYLSSTAAFGRSKSGEEIDETRQWEPSELNTPYAVSKYAAEMEVWRGMEEGLNAGMVNPSIILGPGRPDRSSASLLTRVAEGLKFYPPGSNGFVPLEDVAHACLHVMNRGDSGQRFLLSAQNLTYRELFENMASALNVNPPKTAATARMIRWAWRLEWIKEKLTGKRARVTRINAISACNRVLYNGSAITETGFTYSSVSKAISEAAQFYRDFQGE